MFRWSLKVLSHLSLYSLKPLIGFPCLKNSRGIANTQNCITWKFWVHYLYSLTQAFAHTSVTWLPKNAWAFFTIPDSWSLFFGYIAIFISGLFWRTELSIFALISIPQEKLLLKSLTDDMIWCWEWMGTLQSGNYERGNWRTVHIHIPHPHQRGRWSPQSIGRLELAETLYLFGSWCFRCPLGSWNHDQNTQLYLGWVMPSWNML